MKLKEGTLLQGGRYRIDRVLGQGGFGITYLGEHVMLGRKLAVKEFFMKDLCNRDAETSGVSVGSEGSREIVERFRMKFIKEARSIYRLRHKHIIHVIDVFEENGTAYYVMEHVGGGSLADKVASGALPEADAVRYIRQVASALEYVHSMNVMHLDVKPANILLSEGDNAILIDFGLAKQYDNEGHQTSTTPVGISHGYAPLEQYRRGGVSTFSPATDIYSLGATLYKLVTGLTPPEASDVNDDGLPQMPETISASVRAAIEKAMQSRRKDRPQSISEFIALLDDGKSAMAAGVIADAVEIEPKITKPQPADKTAVNMPPAKAGNVKIEPQAASTADANAPVTPKIASVQGGQADYSNNSEPNSRKAIILFLLLLAIGGIAAALFMFGGTEKQEPVLTDTVRVIETAPAEIGTPAPVVESVQAETAKFATLSIETNPSGATVYIDGSKVGVTPLRNFSAAYGKHTIKLSKTDYFDNVFPCDFNKDKVDIRQNLIIRKSKLNIATTPSGADVYLDGVKAGKTPMSGYEVPYGKHKIRVSKSGYDDIEETFTFGKAGVDIKKVMPKSVENIVVEEKAEEDVVFHVSEENPEFPGGTAALMKYLVDNIKYPRISREKGSQGRVFLRFIVDKDGSVTNVEVLKSSGDVYLDREAVRVAKSMPKWKPGRQAGKAVKVWFTLPVVFRLQ